MWEKHKNAADEVIRKSKEGLKVSKDEEEKEKLSEEIQKATFNRTQSKLFANSLPGRNNIKIDRAQTMITQRANGIVCLLGDGVAYQNVKLDCVEIGGEEWWCAKYNEGDYYDHVGKFNVCPYLSTHILAYSKIIMQCSFQILAKIGTVLLVTDTDSIVFMATPEMWKSYDCH